MKLKNPKHRVVGSYTKKSDKKQVRKDRRHNDKTLSVRWAK